MSTFSQKYPSWPMYFCVIVGVIIVSISAAKFWPTMAQDASSSFVPTPVSRLNEPTDVVRYITYSSPVFNQLASRRRVLFFEANWCATCKESDQNLAANTDKIPNDVTVFKVDFDAAADLKRTYNVTTQNTFVQVDNQALPVRTWIGGGVTELLANLK